MPRRRLWQRLDEATSSHGVTLLVGPVGAGKTLGISGWLQSRGPELSDDAVWLHADAGWTPDRFRRVLDEPAADASSPGPLVVVDDAHALPSATLRLIDDRLLEAPDSMRLLLASRWDLPLNRLVPELLGHLTTIRGHVLRADRSEATALTEPYLRTTEPSVLEAIIERAQGWCAAVVLTARALGGAPDPVEAARRLSEGDTPVADQIASEVFATLTNRQRHLLLCVAGEDPVDPETARHLTNDANAGDLLTELEATGLLVSRLPGRSSALDASHAGDASADPAPRFAIHPLLTEVVRRRLSVDGVDIAQARATVVRAVNLDLTGGHSRLTLARLLRLHAFDAAADVLASDGVHMVLSHGDGSKVVEFTRTHPDMVEEHPATWFPVALDRWFVNDVEGARHWAGRILEAAGRERGTWHVEPRGRHVPDATKAAQLACVRLWRARLGLEPLYAALGNAQRVVAAIRNHPQAAEAAASVLPVVVTEIGVAQNWIGELSEAEASFTLALSLARNQGLSALEASCMTHLAFTQLMAGRERAAVEVATEALSMLGSGEIWRMEFAPSRAALVMFLGTQVSPPWSTEPISEPLPETGSRAHRGDLTTRFWLRIRDARLALTAGSVADAKRILEGPVDDAQLQEEQLPEHLRVVLLLEEAFVADLSADPDLLRRIEAELRQIGVLGEAGFVAGLTADCIGDRRAAEAAFSAADADAVFSQPPTRAFSLACQAQLLDALGEPAQALELLAQAAALTEVRRNAGPFLGWCRQGTPIQTLLQRLAAENSSPWVSELAAAGQGKPDVIRLFETSTALRHEAREPVGLLVPPALSPREREVLSELARGATYADIGAALFVSENTVKTHVSSLYGKLGVSRRSEALAVARAHLLL